MKRWLFNIAAALSLVLAIAAAGAWATSYAGTPGWRLIATAHSADLTRVSSERGTALFTTTPNWSKSPNYGFWDAWWAMSRSGRLTLLAQVVDYDGTLGRVYSLPPSLTVELPGEALPPAVVLGSIRDSGPSATRVGFAFQSDAEMVGVVGNARAWIVTLPYWFIVLIAFPLPLLWLRRVHDQKHSSRTPGGRAPAVW